MRTIYLDEFQMVYFLLKMIEIQYSILIQNADRMPTEFCSKTTSPYQRKE